MASLDDKSTPTSNEDDIRCTCGRLIARRKARHYEIKCPRCKDHVDLPCPDHPASTPNPKGARHEA